MSGKEIIELARVVFVIALVVVAAVLATPPGRLPLALRGLMKIVRKDVGLNVANERTAAPLGKRIAAFALVIIAFIIAKIRL